TGRRSRAGSRLQAPTAHRFRLTPSVTYATPASGGSAVPRARSSSTPAPGSSRAASETGSAGRPWAGLRRHHLRLAAPVPRDGVSGPEQCAEPAVLAPCLVEDSDLPAVRIDADVGRVLLAHDQHAHYICAAVLEAVRAARASRE